MKVSDVIRMGEDMLGRQVEVFGRIVDFQDEVFLVAETASSDDRVGGIRIGRSDWFGPKYGEVVPILVGGFLYEVAADVTGVIGRSTVEPFALEFSELKEVVVHFDGQDYQLNL